MSVSATLATPAAGRGAIALVSLHAGVASELDEALVRVCGGVVGAGEHRLRAMLGVDTGVVARWSRTRCDLMPHGGPAIVRRLVAALEGCGIAVRRLDGEAEYVEARSVLESRMLAVLAEAASPLAVDVLLDQPRRWEGVAEDAPSDGLADASVLSRLLRPPTVVAVGAPSIGKSSLLNALAGAERVLVDEAPGTTRDHVGVLVDLAGLVVRWVDTPGLREAADGIERDALAVAREAVEAADLVLRCGDAVSLPPELGEAAVTVCLRADLGMPGWPADAVVSVGDAGSIGRLAVVVRDALVPRDVIEDPRPWRFW